MNPYSQNHLCRAAELRRRAADLQGDVERMQQQIATDLANALALECRAGVAHVEHLDQPSKAKP